MKNTPEELADTARKTFFAPLHDALGRSTKTRACTDYPDPQHLESGIGRALRPVLSGREWVQHVGMTFGLDLSVSNFFAALRSDRRRGMVEEVAWDVREQADGLLSKGSDPLSEHPELDGFAVYASDGHTHAASAHETPLHKKKRPVSHIYSLNLRTHTVVPLALSEPQGFKLAEHELGTLKRIGDKALRMREPKGVKVIHVYDPAIIDYRQWHRWKQGRGVYILTREKANSALTKLGDHDWDRDDPRNTGVVSDEMVGPSNGYAMRRVVYVDPVAGKRYSFLTNEFTLPPGLIAFLYKLRWDVEKTFDQFKNKTCEKKAWAGNATAKKQQALFICLAHNLMRMLEVKLEREEGVVDKKAAAKRRTRMEEDVKKARAAGRVPNPLVVNWARASQHCLQFIRWLNRCLSGSTPWREAVDLLRPLMARYLW